MKKILIATLTLASIAATPALAQTADHPAQQRGHAAQARTTDTESHGSGYNPYADPYAVIVGNRVVGRDPDANIRLQLKRDVPSDN